MPLLRLQRVLSGMDADPAAELRRRAAKLRLLAYLSEPALPFLPEDAAA